MKRLRGGATNTVLRASFRQSYPASNLFDRTLASAVKLSHKTQDFHSMKHHYKNEISLFRALICQDCKRKLGEATGADYQIMLICRRCKKLNTFHS